MLVSDPRKHGQHFSARRVLILVLVDVGLGHVRGVPRPRRGEPVLILVLVDVGLGHGSVVRRPVLHYVLILVLVDVGLGPENGEEMVVQPCLNPCFSGCWSRTS